MRDRGALDGDALEPEEQLFHARALVLEIDAQLFALDVAVAAFDALRVQLCLQCPQLPLGSVRASALLLEVFPE